MPGSGKTTLIHKYPAQNSFPPFRIAGNLYYVGADDLASYLIVTPKGNILINRRYIKDMRESDEITQTELAQKSEVTKQFLKNWNRICCKNSLPYRIIFFLILKLE